MPSGFHQQIIFEIGACDVLLGRGTGPNENQGNKMFRAVLRRYLDDYRISSTREEKRRIVLQAVKDFKRQDGRFLQKVVLSGKEGGSGNHYKVLDGAAVFLKTRQAFRYMLRGKDSKLASQEKATSEQYAANSRQPVPIKPQERILGSLKSSQQQPLMAHPGISPSFSKDGLAQMIIRNPARKQNPLSLLSQCGIMELCANADKKFSCSPQTEPIAHDYTLANEGLSRQFVSSILPYLSQYTAIGQLADFQNSTWLIDSPVGRAAMLLRARVHLAENIALEQLVEDCMKENQLSEIVAPNLNSLANARKASFSKFQGGFLPGDAV